VGTSERKPPPSHVLSEGGGGNGVGADVGMQ
jgi:hypothetical protein